MIFPKMSPHEISSMIGSKVSGLPNMVTRSCPTVSKTSIATKTKTVDCSYVYDHDQKMSAVLRRQGNLTVVHYYWFDCIIPSAFPQCSRFVCAGWKGVEGHLPGHSWRPRQAPHPLQVASLSTSTYCQHHHFYLLFRIIYPQHGIARET